MVSRALTWAVLAAAGCQVIYSVDSDAPPGGDASHLDGPHADGPQADAPSDAPPGTQVLCFDGSADEDGDGVFDGSDDCPTIVNMPDDASLPQADNDTDGVGNPCDPDAGVLNSITLFDGFADGDCAFHGNPGGIPGGGELSLTSPVTLTSSAPIAMERVIVDLTIDIEQAGSADLAFGIEAPLAGAGSTSCYYHSRCPDGTSGGCVVIAGVATSARPVNPAPRALALLDVGPNVNCVALDQLGSASAAAVEGTTQLGSGTLVLRLASIGPASSVGLHSVIAYARAQ